MTAEGDEAGHRLVAHTADVIIEAWGPTRESCMVHAVHGLVDTFAELEDAPVVRSVPFALAPESDRELLVMLLEEVLYTHEVLGVLPLEVEIVATDDGGIAGSFEVVPVTEAQAVGAVPKAVSRHGLQMARTDGTWSARATIDV